MRSTKTDFDQNIVSFDFPKYQLSIVKRTHNHDATNPVSPTTQPPPVVVDLTWWSRCHKLRNASWRQHLFFKLRTSKPWTMVERTVEKTETTRYSTYQNWYRGWERPKDHTCACDEESSTLCAAMCLEPIAGIALVQQALIAAAAAATAAVAAAAATTASSSLYQTRNWHLAHD